MIMVPLDDRNYGLRDLIAKDPEGNVLIFGATVERAPFHQAAVVAIVDDMSFFHYQNLCRITDDEKSVSNE